MRNLFLTLIIACLLCACSSDYDKALQQWKSPFKFPENLTYMVLEDTVGAPALSDDVDYRFVSYLDAEGCTLCRMRMVTWPQILEQFMAASGANIDMVLILDSDDREDIIDKASGKDFRYPILLDSEGETLKLNPALNDKPKFQTVLLGADGRVLAVGNPAEDPKLRTKMLNVILESEGLPVVNAGEKGTLEVSPQARNVGVVRPDEQIRNRFHIRNTGKDPVVIAGVIPECDCTSLRLTGMHGTVNPEVAEMTLDAGETAELEAMLETDSVVGPFTKHLRLYYADREMSLAITGRIKYVD